MLVGGKKMGGDGLVAWSWEGATSLTPHHLLPRLSEDRGRARVRGGVFERVHREYTCICVHAPVSVSGWVGEWNGRWTGHTPGTEASMLVKEYPPSPTFLTPAT